MKTLFILVALLAAFAFTAAASGQRATPRTSGVYLTAADYREGRLSLEGGCRSKAHKLEIHDVLNKPYVDVTHDSEKRRYSKGDLFGFRACDGRDYRFASNLEYQILEARGLYIYVREIKTRGKGFHTDLEYYFSSGPEGPVLGLTLENLKQAFPDNHRFHDGLDAAFGTRQNVAEYDKLHSMFEVNRLLIVSGEQ